MRPPTTADELVAMEKPTDSEPLSKSHSRGRGDLHPKPRVNIASQKLGFFRWRNSLPYARSSMPIHHGRHNHDPNTLSVSDGAAQRKRTVDEQQMVKSIPKTTDFLCLSSVDPFITFHGQEDPYLVHEIVDHARNSYWPSLAPIQHPNDAPRSSNQGKWNSRRP